MTPTAIPRRRRVLRRSIRFPVLVPVAAAVLLLASSATNPAAQHAVSEAPMGLDTIRFDLGDLPVRIVEVHEDHLVVEFVGRPGSRAEVPRDNVEPEVLYQVRRARSRPDSQADWLDLADIAARHDLHLRRLEALGRAHDLDATLDIDSRLQTARDECASDRLRRARQLLRQGQSTGARYHLQETVQRYEECGAADQARTLLAQLGAPGEEPDDVLGSRPSEGSDQADGGRPGGADQSEESSALDEDLAGLVSEARDELRAGQRASDDYGEAGDHFEEALETLREADRLLAQAGSSEPAAEENGPGRWRTVVDDLMVRTHLELGYLDLALGAHGNAYHHATLAASIDPGAGRVSDLRLAIGAASDG